MISLTPQEGSHASNQEIVRRKEVVRSKEIIWAQVRKGRKQERRNRNAAQENWYAAFWSRWQRRQGEESQTGNRDRPFRSEEKGS
jgi:hypothetical protein